LEGLILINNIKMSMYEILSFALMGHRRASEGSRGILDSSSLGGVEEGKGEQAGRMAPSLLLHSDLCRFVAGF